MRRQQKKTDLVAQSNTIYLIRNYIAYMAYIPARMS